ncbi:hypothetical protein [Priestia megaterium]|jgi:hypothetical protein|uniref:hypothetical protein n=1 Tax=Priestia megaterium TaxID=1404 RepID=UPI0027835176|nr:hypothetical protein [Priestia megaterium]MDQ0808285.1 hypothetical protein [Priestia megaterium]
MAIIGFEEKWGFNYIRYNKQNYFSKKLDWNVKETYLLEDLFFSFYLIIYKNK